MSSSCLLIKGDSRYLSLERSNKRISQSRFRRDSDFLRCRAYIVKSPKYRWPPPTVVTCQRCTRARGQIFFLEALGILTAGFTAT